MLVTTIVCRRDLMLDTLREDQELPGSSLAMLPG